MVISEVFRDPVPAAPLAGSVMLLEGLNAGVARQLTVLDDAELTGTGQSSADALGVPGAVLVDRLTGYLVREIIVRGSSGGPLTPLADQLNHELTRLQGQRIEGTLARLFREVQAALARPDSGVTVAGRPLAEVTSPFVLEVHRPVQPEDAPPGMPVLPPYVRREHDQVLGHVVRAAAGGRSGIAVLVGGSSVGKTRACWEALTQLRDHDPPWRLWHPIDPSRPDAALRELPGIGPRTVVWLNEAQFYLDPAESGLGERVAAGLRELLRDPARAPVLVLATMWPGFWDALTARPPGGEDRHAHARELLAGHDIPVPAAFTSAQMDHLARVADVRMALAARSAPDGAVIQFLAGAPELLARYRNARPAARALIDAAMDARRLGMGVGLPQAFLEAAAPAYLTDAEWDALGEDWLEQSLAYAAVECKGARGPLTRIRARPARSAARHRGDQPASTATAARPLYRLADYLDQHGRAHRASQIPPAEFWSAAAAHAAPGDQAALGDAARDRGLYREAAQLHKNAAVSGNLSAALYLSGIPGGLSMDHRAAHWAAVHVALNNPYYVAELLNNMLYSQREERAALLARDPAAHVALDDPDGVRRLLNILRRSDGAVQQVTALLARDPAAQVSLDNLYGVAELLDSLREAGAHDQATSLARRAAARAAVGMPFWVAKLLDTLWKAGAHEQAAALADRAAAHVPLDDLYGVAQLLETLREAGAHDQAAALAHRAGARAGILLTILRRAGCQAAALLVARDPAAHVPLDDPDGVASLLDTLREAGAYEQVTALLARDPAAHVPLDDPDAVASLVNSLRKAGAHEQVAALADRAATQAPLDRQYSLTFLLWRLREAGAHEQAAALVRRAAAQAPLYDPAAVAVLLGEIQEAGAHEWAAALLARDPAARVALNNPDMVAMLLDTLREAGAHDQAAALADRAATHTALPPDGNPHAVTELLNSLRKADAHDQAAALASRLPAAGMFWFLPEPNRYIPFGREADGTPAAPWGWEDLDLPYGLFLSMVSQRRS